MISYTDFLEFAQETDDAARVRGAAHGLLQFTDFVSVAVTYAPRAGAAHEVAFSYGYPDAVLDYIGSEFVTRDPSYRRAVRSGELPTWESSTRFTTGLAAERWLKPAGYRNGTSVPIRHGSLGEIGSLHMNSFSAHLGEHQLGAAVALAGYLSRMLGERRRRESLRLTARELEVVRLIAAGSSNPEIAEVLYISRATTATHIRNILAKLGVRSRVGIAVEAVRLGIAEDHPSER